ncbi:hypothetical protein niasHT_022484 [Heterodera trifolii]|uniref:Uncharacterized protein n=1 Tax=Heterodera trifolii TaxID=157864 RepID=A0ABD2JGZ4_9BILA
MFSFPSFDELRQKFTNIRKWGHWRGPSAAAAQGCPAGRQKIVIIIPFRDRLLHLRVLLNNLHRFLQMQQLMAYQIVLVNQAFPAGNKTKDRFNRAKLLNVGFVEMLKQFCNHSAQCWDCVVFHDVDFVPENITNIYQCDRNAPKRLISATDEWDNYKYEPDHFSLVNGFSNNYWGWGAEDQNLRERFKLANKSVLFVHGPIGHYKSIELAHKDNDTTNAEMDCACRQLLINNLTNTWKTDGLSSLNYAHLSTTDEILYTNITVDLLMDESLKKGHPCGKKINGIYGCENGEKFHHN